MHSHDNLMLQMKEFADFLAQLDQIPQNTLLSPMAVGKWSAQEAIAHIMAWDENFLQTAVLPLEAGKQARIADDEDAQAFNERAATVGRQLTKQQLLARAARARMQLIEHLERLPARAFQTKQQSGRIDSDLSEFLERNFVNHDRHHMEQIRAHIGV